MEEPKSSLVTQELLEANGRGDLQTICFGTIPSSMWWVLVTMTTVGYGDCFPITVLGKVIAILVMLSGVILLALPITVLTSKCAAPPSLAQAASFRVRRVTDHALPRPPRALVPPGCPTYPPRALVLPLPAPPAERRARLLR